MPAPAPAWDDDEPPPPGDDDAPAFDDDGNYLGRDVRPVQVDTSPGGCATNECAVPEPPAAPASAAPGDDPTAEVHARWRDAVEQVRRKNALIGSCLAEGRLMWLRNGEVVVCSPWQPRSRRTVARLEGPVLAVALSPDAKLLAFTGVAGAVCVVPTGTASGVASPAVAPRAYPGHEGAATGVDFFADNQRLISCSRDGTVRDTVMYSLMAGEWPEVKAHLQHQLAKPR